MYYGSYFYKLCREHYVLCLSRASHLAVTSSSITMSLVGHAGGVYYSDRDAGPRVFSELQILFSFWLRVLSTHSLTPLSLSSSAVAQTRIISALLTSKGNYKNQVK